MNTEAPELIRNPTSYSKLSGFELCPKQHYEVDVTKHYTKQRTEALDEGDRIHEGLAKALQTGSLSMDLIVHQHWIKKLRAIEGEMVVECKWALTAELKPCTFFAPQVWLRTVVDAAIINGPVGMAIDWKTGRSENVKDDTQLTLTALVMFAHFENLEHVGCHYIWLNENRRTSLGMHRHEIEDKWDELLPRFEKLDRAHAENNWPATPNFLCKKYCPVKSCIHHGR